MSAGVDDDLAPAIALPEPDLASARPRGAFGQHRLASFGRVVQSGGERMDHQDRHKAGERGCQNTRGEKVPGGDAGGAQGDQLASAVENHESGHGPEQEDERQNCTTMNGVRISAS